MSVFVFSNLATSLDGKIATRSREYFPLGTPYDREHMLELRREAHAVLMGASTLRSFRKPCLAAGNGPHPINVVLSSALVGISPDWPFFKNAKTKRILLVGPGAPLARLKRFEKRAEIVALSKPTRKLSTARQIVEALEARGVQRLLVEGGGTLMWDFVKEDLIDEYHLTHTPRLVGGTGTPSLVDGEGLDPGSVLALKLVQCRIVGDELYLVYRKTGKRV